MNPSETETPENIAKLLEYERLGYVFHGSINSNLQTIEPNQATDTLNKSSFSTDTAVYASISPAAATAFACMSTSSLPKSVYNGQWSIGETAEHKIRIKIPYGWRDYIETNTGYVYILPKKTFTTSFYWQIKSKDPVVPVDKIEVRFSDYLLLGGIVEWV